MCIKYNFQEQRERNRYEQRKLQLEQIYTILLQSVVAHVCPRRLKVQRCKKIALNSKIFS